VIEFYNSKYLLKEVKIELYIVKGSGNQFTSF
jgi:hypothetical protein